jgi:hypothetical protein
MLGELILVDGSAGDRFGRRRVFALGVAIFTAASVACGLAPNTAALIAARAAQGVGGALLVPGSLAIISAAFPADERGKAIGTWAGFSALTTARIMRSQSAWPEQRPGGEGEHSNASRRRQHASGPRNLMVCANKTPPFCSDDRAERSIYVSSEPESPLTL